MLLDAAASALIVIDIQERLAAAMREPEHPVRQTAILLQAAAALAVPVLASLQYPQGLGPLVAPLAALVPAASRVEKIHFSALAEPAFAGRFRALGRQQAVLAGMEAHVCVLQTALDLLAQRFQVFVVADAVATRAAASHALALARLRQAGAVVVTTEMVVFEWLARADHPEFRPLSRLIR